MRGLVKRIFPVLLAAVFAAGARADLTMTQQIKQEGSQHRNSMMMTVRLKAERMRVDHPQISSIVDLKTGDVTSLVHQQKITMTIPGASMKSMRQALSADSAENTKNLGAPRPTGGKETISGYACEEYEIKSNQADVHVWITKDLPEAEKLMAQLSTLAGETDLFKGFLIKSQVPGFPIRMIIDTPGSGKTTITVVALSEDPIADSEFTVPEGYRTIQTPALPGK